MNNISINSICKMLMKHSRIIVFMHENPDADTIGSCFALVYTMRSLGKTIFPVCADKIPSSLTFMTDGERDFSLDSLPDGFEPDLRVSVDIASPGLTSGLSTWCKS